jgi:hypothetical protein
MYDEDYKIEKLTKPMIGFKKVNIVNNDNGHVGYAIVTIEIPAGARVGYDSCALNWKHRTSLAKVIEIKNQNKYVLKKGDYYCSDYDWNFKWWVGKTVFPRTSPFSMRRESCESGIHFFRSAFHAQRYNF